MLVHEDYFFSDASPSSSIIHSLISDATIYNVILVSPLYPQENTDQQYTSNINRRCRSFVSR